VLNSPGEDMTSAPRTEPTATAEPASGLALGSWGRRISGGPTDRSQHPGGLERDAVAAAGAVDDYATIAEQSAWERTSTAAETQAYAEAVSRSALPHADRLTLSEYGRSELGKPLTLVAVADPPVARGAPLAELARSGKIRVHVNANIHAGEVEGKEAVMQLLREFAQVSPPPPTRGRFASSSLCFPSPHGASPKTPKAHRAAPVGTTEPCARARPARAGGARVMCHVRAGGARRAAGARGPPLLDLLQPGRVRSRRRARVTAISHSG
jgi:hypothetical protein